MTSVRNRSASLVLALLSGLSLALVACGSAGSAPAGGTPAASGSPAAGASATPGAAPAGAPGSRGRGQVIVYSAGPGGLAKLLAKDFQNQTGIRVKMFQSTTGKVLGRLQAERSNPQADVVVLADWAAALALQRQGETYAFQPTGVADLRWVGAGDSYFGYSASALGITYNTKLVANPPRDWTDAAAPQWKGRVVMPDPSHSGSAFDFVGGYLQAHGGSWSLFREMKANGLAVQGANAPALDEVLTGAKAMVLAGVDYMAYADRAKGEPVNIVYPQSGTIVNPRPVLVLKSAHDLANAERFVDFLLSKRGQADVAREYLIPGMRGAAVNPARAGLGQIPRLPVDWAKLATGKPSILREFRATIG